MVYFAERISILYLLLIVRSSNRSIILTLGLFHAYSCFGCSSSKCLLLFRHLVCTSLFQHSFCNPSPYLSIILLSSSISNFAFRSLIIMIIYIGLWNYLVCCKTYLSFMLWCAYYYDGYNKWLSFHFHLKNCVTIASILEYNSSYIYLIFILQNPAPL